MYSLVDQFKSEAGRKRREGGREEGRDGGRGGREGREGEKETATERQRDRERHTQTYTHRERERQGDREINSSSPSVQFLIVHTVLHAASRCLHSPDQIEYILSCELELTSSPFRCFCQERTQRVKMVVHNFQ
jgi:hypothetical protein